MLLLPIFSHYPEEQLVWCPMICTGVLTFGANGLPFFNLLHTWHLFRRNVLFILFYSLHLCKACFMTDWPDSHVSQMHCMPVSLHDTLFYCGWLFVVWNRVLLDKGSPFIATENIGTSLSNAIFLVSVVSSCDSASSFCFLTRTKWNTSK